MSNLASFTDILCDVISDSQPISLPSSNESVPNDDADKIIPNNNVNKDIIRPNKGTGQHGQFRSVEEIDEKYRHIFSYQYFNLVQSRVIDDALYSDKSMVVCAPTGSGKTVVFEMAIVRLLMELDDKNYTGDFKIIYMAPIKALCTERLTEWYPKFTQLGLLCIEVTGDTDVDFSQLKPYRIIITTPEKWDMLTRRWRDHRALVEVIKLFLIDEVHILNDETRGPVLETVVSRMKTIESSVQSTYRIEKLQKKGHFDESKECPRIRFVAISATVSNPEDVTAWLGNKDNTAVFYKFGDECRPVKLKRIVEGYHCAEGTSIFKFDIILNYKLWPIIQKHYNGKPTLIFCNTRKSVALTAETLSKEITINFSPEQNTKLTALASTLKNKKLQSLILSGVGCHHAGLLFEERVNIENAFRNRDLPILITTTTLAMGVNLPAHLVIIKNTQQYVNGAYQEYSISTILQMVGRAGRPQFDTEATAVIMTRLADKPRYQALVGGSEPLQSYLHKRLAENLNSEVALKTVGDVAQCVQWLGSTFLSVRAAKDPRRYLSLPPTASQHLISKKIEELCVKSMNGLASSGLITMDEASCIESTEAGRLMSIYYLDLETMRHIMKIDGTETLERLLLTVCESHELSDMHLRVDERRCLNSLNRNNAAPTIRFPMKGRITTRQMKLNCIIQAVLGCLPIPDPSLNQEAMKIMRIADRVCKCLVAYVTQPDLITKNPHFYTAILNSLTLAKCITAHMWENSIFVSKQLKGIGPTFSNLLATAGKTNFMLLEESHPRDLERIMNKGPPAGNVIRKQVSLLPKYQITATPVGSSVVKINLVLLNQSYLSENLENLTAGESHKCYILIGDSENCLIQLTSFKDKDLISVYDGSITYEITRKHSFEHKIFVHCISSNFVGIDDHCEYVFKDLNIFHIPSNPSILLDINTKKPATKQTAITDIFKERKRKVNNEIAESKEKKKRDYAIVEKFNSLKESFGLTTKELKQDLNKTVEDTNKVLQELTLSKNSTIPYVKCNENELKSITETACDVIDKNQINFSPDVQLIEEENSNLDECNDDRINSLLSEIENEISNTRQKRETITSSILPAKLVNLNISNINQNIQKSSINPKVPIAKKKKPSTCNYSFIDSLEKKIDLNESEEEILPCTAIGFSEAIKSGVSKYLENTFQTSGISNVDLMQLLGDKKDVAENSYNNNVSMDVINANISDWSRNDEIFSKKRPILDNQDNPEVSNKKIVEKIDTVTEKESNSTVLEKSNTNLATNKTNENYRNRLVLVKGNNELKAIANSKIIMNEQLALYSPEVENKEIPKSIITVEKSEVRKHASKTESKPNKTTNVNENYNINSKLMSLDNELKIRNNTQVQTNIMPNINSILNLNRFVVDDFNNPLHCDAPTQNYSDYERAYKNSIYITTENLPSVPNRFINNSPINLEQNPNTNNYTDKNKESFQTYSYSATKVDICNKQLQDCRVQVIRKLKVDLDITEIVSTKTNRENCTNNIINVEPNSFHINNAPEVKYKEQSEDETNKCLKNLPNASPINITNTVNEIDLNQFKDYEIHENVTEPLTIIKDKDRVDTSSNNLASDVTDCKVDEIRSTPEKENKTIASVLQKYSQILSQSKPKEIIQDEVNPKVVVSKKIKEATHSKCKRPFRIHEIHEVNIPIPETLIEKNLQETPDFRPWLIKNKDNPINTPYKRNDDLIITQEQDVMEQQSEINIPEIVLNTIEPKNEECFANTSPLQENNYNIDQSMFDPKALLQQCTENDEDEIIIPPPQKFSDTVPNYSPTLSNEYNLESNFFNEYAGSPINNELVFEDYQLIPSTFEDRTPYENDSLDTLSLQIKPTPAKLPKISLFLSQNVSRKNKLEQFKLARKDKMKIGKY